jgi:hypothetical protein
MKHTIFHMIRISVCSALLLLAGCKTLEIPKETKIPVAVPCVAAKDRPPRPQLMSEAELMALDRYKRTHALWGDRAERQTYQEKLEAVVEGCSRILELKR